VTEDLSWNDLIDNATLRAVWRGSITVVEKPKMTLWWMAWHNISGGQDILHVGVTCLPGADVYGEGYSLAQRMMTGVLNMAWRSVGGELPLETIPLNLRKFGNEDGWTGKVIVKAYTGKQFDPLMIAIQETKSSVEET
jgi:hypothetical protein